MTCSSAPSTAQRCVPRRKARRVAAAERPALRGGAGARLRRCSEAGRESGPGEPKRRRGRSQVVLKHFDLGDDRGGGGLRTLQREVERLARLRHPCLLAADLFFVQAEGDGGGLGDGGSGCDSPGGVGRAQPGGRGLQVYVQFPWFPMDLEKWLATAEATAPGGAAAGRVLSLDVLRGLEHVHFHGVVHCDVKPANVLVTEPGAGGVRRAVLADFDLSLDQARRGARGGAHASIPRVVAAPEVESERWPLVAQEGVGTGKSCVTGHLGVVVAARRSFSESEVRGAEVKVRAVHDQGLGPSVDPGERTQEGRQRGSMEAASRATASEAGGRGTPGPLTMAPEVAEGRVPTDRSDVFGFGGVMARCVLRAEVRSPQES